MASRTGNRVLVALFAAAALAGAAAFAGDRVLPRGGERAHAEALRGADGRGAPVASDLSLPDLTLRGTDGQEHALQALAAKAKLLVVTFFSSECPCQRAHDTQLLELYAKWHPQGVEFVAVDSYKNASLEDDRAEAQARAYPYPIIEDPDAKLADALGAEYATYTVIADSTGRVLYRGGIDSNTVRVRPNTQFYLRDALDDLSAGRAPRNDGSNAMGCAIER